MPVFNYKARDNQGAPISGAVEAVDDLAVATNLRNLGYHVVAIEKKSALEKHFTGFLRRIHKASPQDIILFTRQLSTMLASGLPITTALVSLLEQVRGEYLREVINAILKDIEGGGSFSGALGKHPDVFNELFVSMMRVGETAGILDQTLERVALLNTQEFELRSRIKAAMTYPIILVSVAFIVVSFILVTVLPKFVTIFEVYETRLPIPTVILLSLSNFVRQFWYAVLAVITGCVIGFIRYIRTEQGRYNFDSWLLKAPLFGEFYMKIIVSRFARTLGVLTRSGVPILQALSVTEKTVTNVVVARMMENIRLAITEGQSLAEPFKASGIFPHMVVQMISLGEKSGNLDQALIDVANFYDHETEYTMKNVTVILEPLLLLFMGGVVAFIALSVLLPIFNLIKVFRHGI